MKTQKEMIEALKQRFEGSIILDGIEFSNEYKQGYCIWFKNASDVTYTKKDLNPISAIDNGIYENKKYNMEVYHKFEKWCLKRGWYPSTENYTLNLFKL